MAPNMAASHHRLCFKGEILQHNENPRLGGGGVYQPPLYHSGGVTLLVRPRDKVLDMLSCQLATAQREGTELDVGIVNEKQKHYRSYLDCPTSVIRKFSYLKLTQMFSNERERNNLL